MEFAFAIDDRQVTATSDSAVNSNVHVVKVAVEEQFMQARYLVQTGLDKLPAAESRFN